jgi:glucose-1-phosphate thymidylyltransferase
MKIIIPMAGKGTRLRPHTHTKPKPLMFVAGKPMLGHILDAIKDFEISQIIFVVSGFEIELKKFLDEKYDFEYEIVMQRETLGPAHAIYQAKSVLNDIEEPVLVIYADTIFETDINIINKTKDNIIWVKEVEDPKRFGIVILKNGKIIDLEEKPEHPRSNLAITGMYYLQSTKSFFKALDYIIDNKITKKGEYYINDALLKLMKDGESFMPVELRVWLDCGLPKTVLETNQYLLKRNQSNEGTVENSVIIQPVHIEKGVVIKNSVIGPFVSIDKDAIITDSIIKNSIINASAKISNAQLKNSIVGLFAEVSGVMKTIDIGDDSKIMFKET